MQLPTPRGELSAALVDALRNDPATVPPAPVPTDDPLAEEDLQLALWMCYELHHRGFDGVADGAEWDPEVIAFRTGLEKAVRSALRERVAVPAAPTADDLPVALAGLATDADAALTQYLERSATAGQFAEFVVHRSIDRLTGAGSSSWAIPRVDGRPKAALVRLESDRWGGGTVARTESEAFRAAMRALGLDDTPGHYVDAVPATVLAIVNLTSLFAVHRALRGALAGHLAATELAAGEADRRCGQGLRRLGGSSVAARYFDDRTGDAAQRRQSAVTELCGALVAAEPELVADVLFGAASRAHLERAFAEAVLDSWRAGRSSLRRDLALDGAGPAGQA